MSDQENKKIDIFLNGQYVCSSVRYRNIKQAVDGFKTNPTWAGMRPDGTLGMCRHEFGFCDTVSAWWSSKP